FAKESLLSILPLLLTNWFFYPIYYDQTLFTAFIFFMLTNLYILSRSVGELRLQLERTRQRTQLLQIELLKKNIQPHFLLNTLTSLISWVEESPKSAVKFIEALADEFEHVRTVAEKTLIPIQEEIDLCRAHLKVMQFRNEIPYMLTVENIEDEEKVPPGLFLTILENGLTHNRIKAEKATFTLSFHQESNYKSYIFISPGEPLHEKKEGVTGTGMKYIHARLKESYHDKWTINSHHTSEGWKTEIKIEV
ncbi:MAG: histidine kinase, partial [Bacteroidota bacterium]